MSSGLVRSGRKIRFVAHDYDARDNYTFEITSVGESLDGVLSSGTENLGQLCLTSAALKESRRWFMVAQLSLEIPSGVSLDNIVDILPPVMVSRDVLSELRSGHSRVANWVGDADLAATREDVIISVDGHPTTLRCLHAKSIGALAGGEFEFWVVDDDTAPLMLGLHEGLRGTREESEGIGFLVTALE